MCTYFPALWKRHDLRRVVRNGFGMEMENNCGLCPDCVFLAVGEPESVGDRYAPKLRWTQQRDWSIHAIGSVISRSSSQRCSCPRVRPSTCLLLKRANTCSVSGTSQAFSSNAVKYLGTHIRCLQEVRVNLEEGSASLKSELSNPAAVG
jgi:hypothetical protein